MVFYKRLFIRNRISFYYRNTFFIKFITTNIYVYPRFDDNVARDEDLGYWQFMEYCSLGFAYNF